jgi:5-methylcytosine-specific restriction endonuclease McrA
VCGLDETIVARELEKKHEHSASSERSPSSEGSEAPRRRESNSEQSRSDKNAASNKRARNPRQRVVGRYVPAAVRRAVAERDRECCAYVDDEGRRCRETSALELHHLTPHARGGPPTEANLSLRCRAHNRLAAESDFGREFIIEKIQFAIAR